MQANKTAPPAASLTWGNGNLLVKQDGKEAVPDPSHMVFRRHTGVDHLKEFLENSLDLSEVEGVARFDEVRFVCFCWFPLVPDTSLGDPMKPGRILMQQKLLLHGLDGQ